MNNNKFSFLTSSLMVTGIVSIASLATVPEVAFAKTKSQIAQMAIPITVQINSVAGGGSGVIINQEVAQGEKIYTVLTANHVVRSADVKYEVRTHTGQNYEVISVEHYQKNQEQDPDLAVVKFKTKDVYPTANLGNSNNSTFGDSIAIFGYPYLDENQLPDERPFVYSPGELNNPQGKRPNGYDWLYNAVTQKGMSGGPVFDDNGTVVAIHGRGERFQGKAAFNAGIPINTFVALAPSLANNRISFNNNDINESGPGFPVTPDTNSQSIIAADSPYQKDDRYAGASHFYCDLTGEIPKTLARNVVNGQEITLIEWKDDPNFKWSVTKEERCKIVSGRFQRAYYENRLDYLKIGESSGLPVVCGVAFDDESCGGNNILVTFQPNTNADQWLNSFLQGNTVSVRGEKQGVKNMRSLLSPISSEE